MFQKTKLKKNYITAISMALVLLFANALGLLINTRIGQITPPITDTWENFVVAPTGNASESNPWIINTPENLAYLINNINEGAYYIELNSDIDLAGHEWEPIKTINKNAKVYFDGKGHTIANLSINKPWVQDVGLFSRFSANYDVNLNFGNTTFTNVDIRGGNCGVVVSYSWKGRIYNCQITSGSIIGDENTGAFAEMFWGQIDNCTNNAKVFSRVNSAGGIASYCSTINNCINSGDITGGGTYNDTDVSTLGQVGGIAAACSDISNCINTGSVTSFGKANVGGIVGTGIARNSGFYGEINLRDEPRVVGSIAGEARGTIENCFGVAAINFEPDVVADLSVVNKFGAQREKTINSYSFSKVYTSDKKTTEYRKYNGTDFSNFAYHKNINGGYPFPKSLFAVGQFIDSDVVGYLQDYGFSKLGYEIYRGKSHYYVELGEYPQTYVGDSLNSTLKSWYSSNKPSPVDSYTNDLGTMVIIPHNAYNYNGKKYVRVASAVTTGSYKTQDGNATLSSGQEYWFKVEPIKWWVLNYRDVQNGAAPIVLAEQALTSNVTWNRSRDAGNSWTNSNIRTWLNETFYNDAFDGTKEDIQTTEVKNNSQSSNVDGSGTTTSDNVWLLSYTEANGSSTKRLCSPTDYALVNNCLLNMSNSTELRPNGGTCCWWLRTTVASTTANVYCVIYNGALDNYYVNNTDYAVRPALTLVV